LEDDGITNKGSPKRDNTDHLHYSESKPRPNSLLEKQQPLLEHEEIPIQETTAFEKIPLGQESIEKKLSRRFSWYMWIMIGV